MHDIHDLTRQAISHLQQGQLDAAEALVQQLLALDPEHAEAHHLMGLVAGRRGLHDLADSRISRAVEINPNVANYHVNHSIALRQRGNPEGALAACDRAIRLQSNLARAHNERGVVLRILGRLDEALDSCNHSIQLNPGFVEACISKGNVLDGLDRLEDALAAHDKAIELSATSARAHNMRGSVLRRLGRLDEAMAACETALRLNPRLAGAYNFLGLILAAQGNRDAAVSNYLTALSLSPGKAGVHINLGDTYRAQDKPADANKCYQAAVSLDPASAAAHLGLGVLHWEHDKLEHAYQYFQSALALDAELIEARWAVSLSRISQLDGMSGHRVEVSGFDDEFMALDAWFDDRRTARGDVVVGTLTPFFMAYREQNNRDALAHYGAVCSRLMKHWLDQWQPQPVASVAGTVIRIGIVSAQIKDHPVWHALVKGWLKHLDKQRFELQVFSLAANGDNETAWASTQVERFTAGKRTLREWTEAVVDAQLDVLIYPEICMDAMTVKLASMRLAPVQVTSWGHPETSGLPTMDYYLSAEALEPAMADEHYTEKLIRLPRLGCCYQSLSVDSVAPDLKTLGIDPDLPIALCPGTVYKYMPEHDLVFPEIAKRAGDCQFIFFARTSRGTSDRLSSRLEAVFSAAGLDFRKHVIFVHWLERPVFYGLMKKATIMLDTIGFSGFNTAMQAVECGLPIVTREGRFMRGRLASGILQQMGMQQLVVNNDKDYISIAARLLQQPAHHQTVQDKIEAGRPVLFNDIAPIRALEDFLEKVAQKRPESRNRGILKPL